VSVYNSPQDQDKERTDRMYQREEASWWYSPNGLLTGAPPDALTRPIFSQIDLKNIRRDDGKKKLAALEKCAAAAEGHLH
jgi:hypothetical protein